MSLKLIMHVELEKGYHKVTVRDWNKEVLTLDSRDHSIFAPEFLVLVLNQLHVLEEIKQGNDEKD